MCDTCCDCRPVPHHREPVTEEDFTGHVRDAITALANAGSLRIGPRCWSKASRLYDLYAALKGPDAYSKRRFGQTLTQLGFPAARGTGGVRMREGIHII